MQNSVTLVECLYQRSSCVTNRVDGAFVKKCYLLRYDPMTPGRKYLRNSKSYVTTLYSSSIVSFSNE